MYEIVGANWNLCKLCDIGHCDFGFSMFTFGTHPV